MRATFPSEKSVFRDRITGRQVTKWTASSAIDQPLYFTTPCVTADQKSLVFISERDGSPNLYTVDRRTGEIKKVSCSQGLLRSYVYSQGAARGLSKVSPFLDHLRARLYWIQNDCVYVADLTSDTPPTCIAELPAGWITGYSALSGDGRRFCVPCTDPRAFSSADRSQHEQLNRVPLRMLREDLRTRLYVIDVETGESSIHAELPFWCTHVQFHPEDGASLLCNSEGPLGSGGKRQFPYWGRIWRVDHEGQYRRLFEQQLGQTANHENWIPDGSGVIFHGKVRPVGLALFMNFALRIAVRLGLAKAWHVEKSFSHYVAARSWGGSEIWRAELAKPVSHAVATGPRSFVYDNRLGQISHCAVGVDGMVKDRLLCLHDSSMSDQDSHPHPSPAPDGKSVIFGSDVGGSVNVYEVELS